MASGLESSPFAKFWIRSFLKPKVQPKKPKLPKHNLTRPSYIKRSISAPLLPTIDEEAGEGHDEADIEDNEHVSPDASSSNEAIDAMVSGKLSVTAKPAARVLTRSHPSSSSSAFRQEVKLISKRVSDLEGSLAFAQEQIQERDERLFECQQSIAEDIAKGISDGLDRQCTAWEAHHVFQLRSKDRELEALRARIEECNEDLRERDSFIQSLSEPGMRAFVVEAQPQKEERETVPKTDIVSDGPNSFL